jgi:hypothetical protein
MYSILGTSIVCRQIWSTKSAVEIVADIDDAVAEIVLIVHWIGGVHSKMRLPKRRRGQRNSTSADVIAAVRQFVLIADRGHLTPL